MAITTVDQLRIYSGEISPTNNTLKDLSAHIFLKEAFDKLEAGYTTGVTIDADAQSYINKDKQAVSKIISFTPSILEKLLRYTVLSLGEQFTITTMENLEDDDDWQTKIEVVSDKVWQKLGEITDEEITAYNNL